MADPSSEPTADAGSLWETDLDLPWHSYLLPAALAAVLFAAWALFPSDAMQTWALSRASLGAGWSKLLTHMFAHGGLVHVAMNSVALLVIGPRIIARIGSPPISWARFVWVFLGSGMTGGMMFLILNDRPHASALGASGAIFGLIGALARVHPATGVAVSILSRRSWLLARMFIRDHLVMFALIFGAIVLTGQSALVAWEAHLGGMLFGLFVAPLFLPRAAETS